MKIENVRTYQDLERYLRVFSNFLDDLPYDFVGAYMLFLAILDNMIENHIDADIENLREHLPVLTESQRNFLQRLLELDQD